METESTPELQLAGANLNSDPNSKPKIVVIMGATGSGKSKLAIDLASHFPIEIINADSMQVYRGLDVLTNKVPDHEQKGVPHHLLGTVSPNVEFTAKDFRDAAIPLIDEIWSRNCLPVIVGGTNYYIQALVSRFLLDDHAEDPEANCLLDLPGQNWGRADNLRYDCCFICLDASLPALDQYVNQRVDLMVSAGLLEEVRDIYKLNADYTRGLRQAIGVREFEDFLKYWNSECLQSSACPELFNENICQIMDSTGDDQTKLMLKEAIEKVKLNTRRLVRRQACGNKELRGAHEWEQHQRGRSHRKRVSHLRKSGHLVRFEPEK
ncbi:UNVERIFIED_CONTAM: tRNA dimethylallyltransferase 2 [Sesamum latifolium]|uniref:tRNA dimethylallyltransferase 2 n=1 Tax=Sesamum latifolium TaxID=2727402 RepID=A0AAW2Y372_9LAMI